NENEDRTYPNFWDTLKAVLRGKLKALIAHMKNLENSHTRKLTAQLKALEHKKPIHPEEQMQQIIKLMAEINKMKTR
ncbi:hypothetical protein ACQP3D_31205, partial [Escherichia coli]